MAAKKKAAAAKGRKAVKTTAAKRETAPPARAAAKAPAKPAIAAKPVKKAAAAKKAPAAKPAVAAAAAAATASSAEVLARKIVKYTTAETAADHLKELYTEDCISVEATGDTVTGHDGIQSKFEQWNGMQEHSSAKPRHVLVKGNLIVIEWENQVKLRDGRSVSFCEVAVHEVRGGKIAAERYYYNPAVFSGSSNGQVPRVELPPEPLPAPQPPRGSPPVDPLDL